MNRIYFDNAATTALDPEVLHSMMPFLTEKFGNPSSIHSFGREAKMAIETARKSVARHLNCQPKEIFFTSGGTESSNTAIRGSVFDLGCSQIISSALEHHATLHTIEHISQTTSTKLNFVNLTEKGHIDLNHLETLLKDHSGKSLVTLMHANNEIGNLLSIKAVGELVEKYQGIFHSDTVQTLGHYPIDLSVLKLHFANGAGHKFHGPKGTGILFVRNSVQVSPLIQGGAQERNMRAGTENVCGIVGFAKALDLVMKNHEADRQHIEEIRNYLWRGLQEKVLGIKLNSDEPSRCLYTVLNVAIPKTDRSEMILFNLDMAGVSVSGGSACSSGANNVSHVIKALNEDDTHRFVPIRFSFCKNNTKEEVDRLLEIIQNLV